MIESHAGDAAAPGSGAVPSDGVPSRTSQAVATIRAQLVRPRTPAGDPDAQQRLCAGMRPAQMGPRLAQIPARTRWVDAQVLAAIERGTGQVVILGAGYDDRALRFRSPGVRFFELDHPGTQNDKRRRLERMGADTTALTLAPADFSRDDVDAVLGRGGHDRQAPSLFVCEGLLVYLDQETIAALLSGLRRRAASRSALAASLAVHADGMDSRAVIAAANAARASAVSEPWRTILPAAAHLDLLRGAGWLVDESADPRPASEHSLLVTARPA